MSESGALTADEVAAILRVSKNTVYNLVKREELAAYHVGRKMRFSRDDVANYVARRTGPRSELLEGSVRMPSVRSEAPAFAVRARAASFVIAGNDILGDMLANYLGSVAAGSTFERVYEGSYAALCDLYAGRAHAALVHLYDRLSYNLPFVERLVPGVPVRMVRLVGRRQGLIVAKGNPRGLRAWEDLAREGVRLVNRERGCGSRVLFDEKMREFGLNARAVNGYDREVSSALTAASLVARGAADVCIGSERVFHQVEGVDFLPLQDEWLDIAFLENERSIPIVDAAVRLIRSRAFKEEASRIVGYSTEHMGETVYKR